MRPERLEQIMSVLVGRTREEVYAHVRQLRMNEAKDFGMGEWSVRLGSPATECSMTDLQHGLCHLEVGPDGLLKRRC